MITGVSIKNFKVFKSLEAKGLSRVTLISGRNNCGKTTLLEAIFTLFDRNNLHNIPHLLNRRGVDQVVLRPEELWAPIFHNYEMKEEIEISLTKNGERESVTYRYLDSYPRTIASGPVGETGGVKLIQTGQSSTYMQALEMNYRLKDNVSFTSHCFIGPGGLELVAGAMDPQNYPVAILPIDIKTSMGDPERFGILDIDGKADSIMEILKVIEPNLKSLSVVVRGDTKLIYGDVGMGRKIPVLYMGEGLSRLLTLSLQLATFGKGTVLVDEIGTGIHHSVLPNVWKALFQAAEEFDCQIIGTTHSYECIEAAYSAVPPNKLDSFTYIRLARKGDITIPHVFDYEMMQAALESDWEVR
ncbi:MAG: AAA family ATPase [Deltaproteobacteria bacterium]|nr:AAA family ATPase [Deltaproteobacteria bacterium]